MHEHESRSRMATSSQRNGQSPARGSAQCQNAGRPVVKGRAQHGPRVADPAESACTKAATRNTQADMEGVCPSGRGNQRNQGEPRKTDGVALVGGSESAADATVHPEGEAVTNGTPVSTSAVVDLLKSQRYRCALTGRALTPESAALDHFVPVRCGGPHVIENAQVLHKDVNRAKGSLTNAEFIGLCNEVVRWSHGSGGGGEEATS